MHGIAKICMQLYTYGDKNCIPTAFWTRLYTEDFALLNAYDRGDFGSFEGTQPNWDLGGDDACALVRELRDRFPALT
jgi:hypothetical protein